MKFRWISLFVLIISLSAQGGRGPASAVDFKALRTSIDAKKYKEASLQIKEQLATATDKENQSLLAFLGGWLKLESGETKDAIDYFQQSIKVGSRVEDHVRYHLAHAYLKGNDSNLARAELQRVADSAQNSELMLQAKIELAQIYLDEKKWNEAARLYSALERKTRSREAYPEVLFGLMKTDLNGKRRNNACKWARKLYSRFPGHALVKKWDLDLQKGEVDGKAIGCIATPDDQKNRLKNLQFAGEFAEAKREIDVLLARTSPSNRFNVEKILANFYIEDGYVTEAMKVLEPYSKTEATNVQYLTLIAKAGVRSGDFQVAVSAYDRAHNLAPGSRQGQNSLYMAANLSFMSQDYDGALRRYETLSNKYGRGGVARDAAWFLAFTRYMRGDYQGALSSFSKLKPGSERRSRRKRRVAPPPAVTQDRIKYWSAMCYMRMGRSKEAKIIFQSLAQDRGLGYYALAARTRIATLPEGPEVPQIIAQTTQPSTAEFNKLVVSGPNESIKGPIDMNTSIKAPPLIPLINGESPTNPPEVALNDATAKANPNEEVTDEDLTSLRNEAIDSPEIGADPADSEDEEVAEDSSFGDSFLNLSSIIPQVASQMKDPRLLGRFQRASDLYSIGLTDWVRSELVEVERRTVNREYLRRLMDEYELSGNFNRSSTIGDLGFRMQRLAKGFAGEGHAFWEKAYPQAYKPAVNKFSQQYAVPSEFVWSIMRAESQFRPEVKSSVGALGLMQIMPMTAYEVAKRINLEKFEPVQLLRPDMNVQVGSRYLAKLFAQFQGRIALAAAAYNAGPHRVEAWIKYLGKLETDEFVEHIPFAQTRNYVKKVTHNFAVYNSLYGGSGQVRAPAWLAESVGVTLDRPVSPREVWEAN